MMPMKNPAEMSFNTIVSYYQDRPRNNRNWVFPIITDDLRCTNGKSTEMLDSQPKVEEVQT